MLRQILRGLRPAAALLLVGASTAARAQSPATFLVGADEVCDYATIQQAIKIGGQDLEIIGFADELLADGFEQE